jgi:hypothetical protein
MGLSIGYSLWKKKPWTPRPQKRSLLHGKGYSNQRIDDEVDGDNDASYDVVPELDDAALDM